MSDLTEIDAAIVRLKSVIERADTIERLRKNRDFKRTIIEYYGTDYAAELVRAKAQPQVQDDKSQRFIDSQINAVGHLFNFLDLIITEGVSARENLEAHEDERLLMINEEADDAR